MRIALVSDYFQPKVGYQEFFLAKYFKEMGHEVLVITSNRYYPFPAYEQTFGRVLGDRQQLSGSHKESGIAVTRLPMMIEMGSGAIVMLKHLKEALITFNPDVVFADGIFTPLSWQVAKLKESLGFSLIVDTHASSFNTDLTNSLAKRFYMKVFTRFFKPTISGRTDFFTAVGESEQKLFKEYYPERSDDVALIPLGADTRIFHSNNGRRQDTRRELQYSDQDLVCIYAGKMTPAKDLEILLDAFKQIEDNRARLLLVGNGSEDYMSLLRIKATGANVSIINSVPNNQLSDYYNAADIGVWPGNLSNTVLEAMACGLPVVVPKQVSAGQTTDHLARGEAALQFERGSTKALHEVLVKLMRDKRLLLNRGKRCQLLIESEYSWREIARQHLEVYNKISEREHEEKN